MKRLLLLVGLVLALGACGDTIEDGNSVNGDGLHIYPHTVTYNGQPLYCLTHDRGITCDWVRYHNENPR